jgi:predicted SnoaL-like aldol condensation-catalyzing enzyme
VRAIQADTAVIEWATQGPRFSALQTCRIFRKENVMKRLTLMLVAAILALTVYSAYGADPKHLEINKKNVVEFYNLAINKKDFEAASKYMGPKYIQHNPLAPDGHEGLKGFLKFLREKLPNLRSEIKRVFAEGDYVILHVHEIQEPGTRGNAIVDIYRLENGKVVEHWDVIQPIPEKAANPNGMF